jgi:hypothetical protein
MRKLANVVAGLLIGSGLTLLSQSAVAQVHGVPASATSLPAGFNGFHGFPAGIPAGATSLGPQGFTPVRPFSQLNRFPLNRFDARGFRADRLGRQQHLQPFFAPLGYSPYYFDMSSVPGYDPSTSSYSAQIEPSSDGTPSRVEITVVDKRSGDKRSDSEDKRGDNAATNSDPAAASAPPVEDAVAKTLVMRDGSKREIRNYAILGKNIFDLSDGRSRRIPLDDVDVPATAKANEENGVDFKLP